MLVIGCEKESTPSQIEEQPKQIEKSPKRGLAYNLTAAADLDTLKCRCLLVVQLVN